MRFAVDGPAERIAPVLWMLLAAFALRVGGQLVVALTRVEWLPPMEAWMSGLMPYRYLLPAQVFILVALGKICVDFTRGDGWGVRTRPFFRQGVLAFGCVYLAAMLARLAWSGRSIPVVFHFVLATFLLLFASWHRGRRA